MTRVLGTTFAATAGLRKPKSAYDYIMAEDDGLLHEGEDMTVVEEIKNEDADLSDLFKCKPDGLLKLARRIADNDLIENEARVLAEINSRLNSGSTFSYYIPKFLQSVRHDGRSGVITSFADGFISLAEIIRAYPAGIDFRDMVWMYKRVLVALGYAHSQGVLHGAILPPHVLVHPKDHGAVIVDWSYALTDPMERIKAMSLPYEDFYPPEVRRKELPKTGTDIYMAAKCAVALLGGDVKTDQIPDTVPEDIRDFFSPSLDEAVRRRPQGAWDLHVQFDALLKKVVGPPEYRPFAMPGKP